MTVIIDGTTGITSPAESVSGNLNFTGTGNRITGDFSNATIANRVMLQTSTTNAQTSVSAIPNGTSANAQFDAFNSSDSTNSSVARFAVNATDARILSAITGTGTYLPMTFYTGGSERVRIDTSGNVGIGTSSPNQKLVVKTADGVGIATENAAGTQWRIAVNGDNSFSIVNSGVAERARIDSSGTLMVNTTNPDAQVDSTPTTNQFTFRPDDGIRCSIIGTNYFSRSGDGPIFNFRRNATTVGTISVAGSSTSYNTSSDYRLKEEMQPMTGALAKVLALIPVTYKWKVDGSDGQGFIAHELAEVVPECVTGEKDAVDAEGNPQYQGIDTSFLIATLSAAIQELHALVKTQDSTITALAARITALEGAQIV